jgi:hypothetical protein
MRVSLFLFALALMLGRFDLALAKGSDHYDAIRHVVNEFITGWRDGDAERLDAAANLEHGHAIWQQVNDGQPSVHSVTFAEMIEGLKPHPEYGVPYKILSIEIAGDELAFANIAAQQGDRGTILDYFTLMKVDGSWEVVALEWLWRPGMLVEADQGQ